MLCEVFAAIILPPGNISDGHCGRNDIYITIHIKISSENIADASKSSDDVLTECLAAVVLKPGKFGTTRPCSQNVNIAIPVNIGSVNCLDPIEPTVNATLGPSAVSRRTVILPPSDVIRSWRRSQHIYISITVKISGVKAWGVQEVVVDGAL